MRTLARDVDTLGRALGTVLREQAGEAFYELEEQVRLETKSLREQGLDTAPMQALIAALPLGDQEQLVRAFTAYFQLINLAEEYERSRKLSLREGPRKQGIEEALTVLHKLGHSAEAILQRLRELDFGLTFTAHPTELRRRTVRRHLEGISEALVDLGDEAAQMRILAHIEALWSTQELRHTQPTVADEVSAGLAYIDVIASVLPDLERDLQRSFAKVFGTEHAEPPLPFTFHSWMGGDRDGNPQVTAQVTRETFARHESRARTMLDRAFTTAFTSLSQHHARLPATTPAPAEGDEPFRQQLTRLREQLQARGTVPAELHTLGEQLRERGQRHSADAFARPLLVQARIFGLHLASLDIREHSGAVGRAVAELLALGKVTGAERYLDLAEHEKQTLLLAELQSARPLLAIGQRPSEATCAVLDPVWVAREADARTGAHAFGRYVVSMSEAPSDLLEVLILAREAGVPLMPVPLFETLRDLENAPSVMAALLDIPLFRQVHGRAPIEIMIGYSDSNKDAGFFAASWALHEAQRKIAKVFDERNVKYRFFHGRGTSIGRGGGPMARALSGQPAGTLGAGLRITEQGEALQDKYSNPRLAYRNLEQGLYGMLVAAGRGPEELAPERLALMDQAAARSVQAYRRLVEDADFLRFFEAVTPIDEIANLRIASRPVRRPGPATLQNLRAIPWVMSWTQCRANVPGWYGLADALETLGVEARALYAEWSFFRATLDNAQMSLGKSDMAIFRGYLSLADDDRLGKVILDEYARTKALVEEVVQGELLCHEPNLARSIQLRNPYIDPIHRVQIELLRQSRAQGETAPDLARALLLSIKGIAAGMRNTG